MWLSVARVAMGALLIAVVPTTLSAQQSSGSPRSEPQRDQAAATAGDAESLVRTDAVTEADRLFNFIATRVSVGPVIDGVLDDLVWSQTQVLTELTQSEPDEGQPITERTEIRVVYDDRAIYISAVCYDSDPSRIVATVLRRDERNDNNDAFMVTLDTYHDHRNAYFFETNPMGARYDAQIVGEGGGGRGGFGLGRGFNADWDAVWEARSRITDEGWVTEISIPFVELRFDTDQSAWGINFRRTIRRKTEKSYWATIPRQFNHTRLSLSGMMDGVQLAKPRNIRVVPFLIGSAARAIDPVSTFESGSGYSNDFTGDFGGDGKWGITPNLTLDMTINTDFSQVEADDEQINLTRFSLFFPEKRDFFLENAGFFDFGGGGGGRGMRSLGGGAQVVGFHSRRIGIGPDNEEIPLYGGGRLTGKIGPWSVGTLLMQSEATNLADGADLVPSNNYVVGRVTRDLGSRSRAGVLFTNRQANGDDYNRELGFDGRWGINAETTMDAWAMKTETPGLDGEDWAGQVRFAWSSPLWQVSGSYVDIGENFNPEMGFVNRTGIRFTDPAVFFTPFFPNSRYFRNLNPHVNFRYTTDRDGEPLSRYMHFDFDAFLKRGDKLSVAYNNRFELLLEPFEIVEGVIIPPGSYDWGEIELELQSDAGRPIDAMFKYTSGGFWGGERSEYQVRGGWRAGARFNLRVTWTRNAIVLPEGAVNTDLVSTRVGVDFSPDLSVGALIQYNSDSDQTTANVRLRYIYHPGSDFFIVYNERRLAEQSNLLDRAIIVKLTRLFRF